MITPNLRGCLQALLGAFAKFERRAKSPVDDILDVCSP